MAKLRRVACWISKATRAQLTRQHPCIHTHTHMRARTRTHSHMGSLSPSHTHTHKICNTYCFSTATVVLCKHLSVTSYCLVLKHNCVSLLSRFPYFIRKRRLVLALEMRILINDTSRCCVDWILIIQDRQERQSL